MSRKSDASGSLAGSGTHRESARLEELQAEARYHRERFELYRARAQGTGSMRLGRLRELEQTADRAATRLRRATEDVV